MLNKRDKAIIASIHIRSAIKGLGNDFANLSAIIYIDLRCFRGEQKFQKAKPYRYHELKEICKLTASIYDRKYGRHAIATDTFIDCLYHDHIHEFKNYFKLKDKSFGRLFQMFGEDDELEVYSIEAATHLTQVVDKAEEIFYWRQQIVMSNMKRRAYEERIKNS